MLLALLSGALVGAALGLTGGGGSILAVPLLVYALGLELRPAVALSLAVVGLAALYGAILQMRRGHVRWRAGGTLGVGGILAAPAGAWVGGWLPQEAGLYLFSALMVVVGVTMLRNSTAGTDVPLGAFACHRSEADEPQFSWSCAAKLMAAGAITGMLSGIFGVGGGFLVVPALRVVLRVTIGTALATSLVAIALISSSAWAANAVHLQAGDLPTGLVFLLGTGAGITGGVALKQRIPEAMLKRVFGGTVIAMAGLTVAKTYLA